RPRRARQVLRAGSGLRPRAQSGPRALAPLIRWAPMRPRRLFVLASSALVLGGCLLTSDFDGITGGAASAEAGAAEPDAGPWTPTPCVGKLECLGFDEPTTEPNGWQIDRTASGNGQIERTADDVAIGPGALRVA